MNNETRSNSQFADSNEISVCNVYHEILSVDFKYGNSLASLMYYRHSLEHVGNALTETPFQHRFPLDSTLRNYRKVVKDYIDALFAVYDYIEDEEFSDE